MNIKPAGCYILLLFSLCLVTPASSSSGQPSDVFQRADHNGDGLIDPAEFQVTGPGLMPLTAIKTDF